MIIMMIIMIIIINISYIKINCKKNEWDDNNNTITNNDSDDKAEQEINW